MDQAYPPWMIVCCPNNFLLLFAFLECGDVPPLFWFWISAKCRGRWRLAVACSRHAAPVPPSRIIRPSTWLDRNTGEITRFSRIFYKFSWCKWWTETEQKIFPIRGRDIFTVSSYQIFWRRSGWDSPSQLLNLRKKMLVAHLRLLLVITQFSFLARTQKSVVAHTNTYLTCCRHVDQLAHVYSNTPVHLYQNFQILLLISIKLFKYSCSIFERNEKSQTNHWQLSSFENRRMRLTVAKQNTKWSCW
jgi:hypothetical protein